MNHANQETFLSRNDFQRLTLPGSDMTELALSINVIQDETIVDFFLFPEFKSSAILDDLLLNNLQSRIELRPDRRTLVVEASVLLRSVMDTQPGYYAMQPDVEVIEEVMDSFNHANIDHVIVIGYGRGICELVRTFREMGYRGYTTNCLTHYNQYFTAYAMTKRALFDFGVGTRFLIVPNLSNAVVRCAKSTHPVIAQAMTYQDHTAALFLSLNGLGCASMWVSINIGAEEISIANSQRGINSHV